MDSLATVSTDVLPSGYTQEDLEKRKESLKNLQKNWPSFQKSEAYRYVPITSLLPTFITLNSKRNHELGPTIAVNKKDYSNTIVFSNGVYCKKCSQIDNALPIDILPLNKAFHGKAWKDVSTCGEKYERISDPFDLLNTAMWQEGIMIHVKENTTIKKPLNIHHVNNFSQSEIISHNRLAIVIESGSKASIIQTTDSVENKKVYTNLTEEIILKENASLEYTKIQTDRSTAVAITNTHIYQSKGSALRTHVFSLDGQVIRNNLNITIDGKGCDTKLYGLYIIGGKMCVDNHTTVDHKQPDSTSSELYKGIIHEQGTGVFDGKIYVRPQAKQTYAFQSNKNLVLNDKASMHMKPQLEIWADDVQCSHGCTSGQLSEDALFYLRSRGMNLPEAINILLHSFIADLIPHVSNQYVANHIKSIIVHKLNKEIVY